MYYRILDPSYTWEQLFTKWENVKADFPLAIMDYSIRETALYDVYQGFAVKQLQYKENHLSSLMESFLETKQ